MSTVKITKADFTSKVEQGWKREQLIEHYGIRNSDVTAILKQLGLTIKKTHKPRFELIDDEDAVATEEVDTQEVPTTETAVEVVEEVAQVEEKKTRTRRTKAEIEAEKAAKEESQAVEIQEDTEVAETATVEDSVIGEATVVEEVQPVQETQATEEVDVLKATEDVQTSFNIPNGAGQPSNVGSEEAFNAQPTGSDVAQENPFLKAWGNPQ